MLVKEIDFYKDIFNAYPHQRDFISAFFSGKYKYFMECIHRRGGKDASAFSAIWLMASIEPGNYVYTLPKIGQARNVVWEGKDLEGRRWIDQIPRPLILKMHETSCKIYFVNGSILHITGADNLLQSHLGSNLKGIVVSEFQKTNPKVWDYVRPILKRSNGIAIFLYTAFGKGHAYRLFQTNKDRKLWHCRKLTVAQTEDNDGKPIFSESQIQEERDSGMDEALVLQEYYCDEDAPIKGAFFAYELKQAEDDGRIIEQYEVDPHLPVHTSWDLGSSDTNSIWFFQFDRGFFYYFNLVNEHYRSIEYYGELLQDIKSDMGFRQYGHHFMPHDVANTDYGVAKSRRLQFIEHGVRPHYVPRVRVIERVQVARYQFKNVIISRAGCEHGIDALRVTRPGWDDDKQVQTSDEVHDWSSHISAAFQYGLVGWLDHYNNPELQKVKDYAIKRR